MYRGGDGTVRRQFDARRLPVVLGSVIAAALCLAARGGSATPEAALFVSATGSDSSLCTKARPCLSFDRAYRVAKPGQIVEVEGGTYAEQMIRRDSTKTSGDDVVFRPAAGATVNVPERVVVSGSNITFAGTGLGTGFVFSSWSAFPGARRITFDRVNAGIFAITAASQIRVLGGQVGPWPYGSDSQINSDENGVNPTDILIDGVFFHDVQRKSDEDHTECLQIGAGQNVVIRNNRFVRCSSHDVFIHAWQPIAGNRLSNFTIENNFFGQTTIGYYAGQFAKGIGTCDDFVMRNNVFEQNWVFACPSLTEADAPQVIGNYWVDEDPPSACGSVGVWRLNMFDQRPQAGCDAAQKLVLKGREMTLARTDALRRISRVGLRCADPAVSTARSSVVCSGRLARVDYQALVVAGPSGAIDLVRVNARGRSGSVVPSTAVLSALAAIPVQGQPKLVDRIRRFVEKWVPRKRSADGRFGATRVRLYPDGEEWNLLLSG